MENEDRIILSGVFQEFNRYNGRWYPRDIFLRYCDEYENSIKDKHILKRNDKIKILLNK